MPFVRRLAHGQLCPPGGRAPRLTRPALALALLLSASLSALAAAGDVDPTFNPGVGTGRAGTFSVLAVQPDGKILAGGSFSSVDGVRREDLARLNSNGTLDTSFQSPAVVGTVSAVAVQPDGDILIGGFFIEVGGVARTNVARLNPDGTLDASFNPTVNDTVEALVRLADGDIIIGGSFTTVNGVARNRIARLNPDGTLDNSFDPDAPGGATAIAGQPDGKILLGYSFGFGGPNVLRLNLDGSLDNSFVLGTGSINGIVSALTLQPDGKILVGGNFTSVDGVTRLGLARLNPDGTLDNSFQSLATASNVTTIAVEPDGDVLVGGSFTSSDGSFNQRVLRFNSAGARDANFHPALFRLIRVEALVRQPDGKVIIGGDFATVHGVPRRGVARLNPDGSLDTTFLNGLSGAPGVRALALLPDGDVLVGGSLVIVNGIPRRAVARLNPDGSLDETFLNFTPGADDIVQAIALQPDGKVLVAGYFSAVNGVARAGAARLTVALSPNPIDVVPNFVTQHYRDFFNREPDAPGLAFWSDQITSCGTNAACREVRTINVSAAFFLSIEFQQTGFIVYKTYGAAFGTRRVGSTVPLTFQEFLPDLRAIGAGVIVQQGDWEQRLEANKVAYFNAFVARPAFTAAYPASMSAAQFVDALNANSGGSLTQAERDALVNALAAGTMTRAQVLRAIAEDSDFSARERNRAFVLMQYFGYLRRNPFDPPEETRDFAGFNFWLGKLNDHNGDFVAAEMVKAFITSGEYRERFGQ